MATWLHDTWTSDFREDPNCKTSAYFQKEIKGLDLTWSTCCWNWSQPTVPSKNPKKHSTPNESFLVLGSCEFIWPDFSWHCMTCDMQLRIFGFEEVSCHLCTAASHATNQSSTHRARRDKTSSRSSVRHGWGENQGLRISKWCKENRGGFSRRAWMSRKMAGSSMAWYFPMSVVSHLLL